MTLRSELNFNLELRIKTELVRPGRLLLRTEIQSFSDFYIVEYTTFHLPNNSKFKRKTK